MAVRAAVLIGLGLALDLAGAQVVIVLVHLGVLVVVAGLFARLPVAAVVAVAVAAFVVGGTTEIALLRGGPTAPTACSPWRSTPRSASSWRAGGCAGRERGRWCFRWPSAAACWSSLRPC